jgi:nucleoside diphosphate kinase
MAFYHHPTDEDIKLLNKDYPYAVTVYKTFDDTLTATIKRDNLETVVRTVLKDLDVKDRERAELREKFNTELEDIIAHGNSFAVFISPEFVKIFNVPNRLNDETKIGTRFNISNLLRVEAFPQEGYVLIANKDKWALYHGTRDELVYRVDMPETETLNLLSANNKENNFKHIQQTSHKDAMKAMVPRYAKTLSELVVRKVRNIPTVVVADSILMGGMRPHWDARSTIFIDHSIHPDTSLHEVENILRTQMEAFNQLTVNEFMAQAEKLESSDLTAEDLTDIIHSAVKGKVDTLLIDRDWDEKAAYVDGQVTFDTDKSIIPFLLDTVMAMGGRVKVVNSEEMVNHSFNGILAIKRFN